MESSFKNLNQPLAEMPLQMITETLGEAGLTERFALEVNNFKPEEQEQIWRAHEMARFFHKDDSRGDEPYMNHLLRVSIRIMSHYEIRDADIVTAAVLHDIVEDHAHEIIGGTPRQGTDDYPREEAIETIGQYFNSKVAGIVDAVTNPKFDPSKPKYPQYWKSLSISLREEPDAVPVKASDGSESGRDGNPRRALKYRGLMPILIETIHMANVPLSAEVIEKLDDQFHRASERFDKVLVDQS